MHSEHHHNDSSFSFYSFWGGRKGLSVGDPTGLTEQVDNDGVRQFVAGERSVALWTPTSHAPENSCRHRRRGSPTSKRSRPCSLTSPEDWGQRVGDHSVGG